MVCVRTVILNFIFSFNIKIQMFRINSKCSKIKIK